jgi:Protein of unknown function (DUF2514)
MNPWLILGAVLAVGAAAAGGYYQGNQAGQAEIQQQWDNEKTAQYAQYAKAMEESVEAQQQLQMGADKLRQEKDREIRDITARNTALANSLRDRQSRPATNTSAVPSTASVGPSACTGKDLYREDSEFLVRIAREADELRAALKQCYKQYESVR